MPQQAMLSLLFMALLFQTGNASEDKCPSGDIASCFRDLMTDVLHELKQLGNKTGEQLEDGVNKFTGNYAGKSHCLQVIEKKCPVNANDQIVLRLENLYKLFQQQTLDKQWVKDVAPITHCMLHDEFWYCMERPWMALSSLIYKAPNLSRGNCRKLREEVGWCLDRSLHFCLQSPGKQHARQFLSSFLDRLGQCEDSKCTVSSVFPCYKDIISYVKYEYNNAFSDEEIDESVFFRDLKPESGCFGVVESLCTESERKRFTVLEDLYKLFYKILSKKERLRGIGEGTTSVHIPTLGLYWWDLFVSVLEPPSEVPLTQQECGRLRADTMAAFDLALYGDDATERTKDLREFVASGVDLFCKSK